MNTALRAMMLGAATGARSMTGLATVALTTPPGTQPAWLARLAGPRARRLTSVAAIGEIMADKTPMLPSRLAPPALAERIGTGAISAAALARREGARPALPVLLGVAAVVGASVAGACWRAYAQRRGRSVMAAVAEDLVAIGLATAACRQGRGAPREPDASPAASWQQVSHTVPEIRPASVGSEPTQPRAQGERGPVGPGAPRPQFRKHRRVAP